MRMRNAAPGNDSLPKGRPASKTPAAPWRTTLSPPRHLGEPPAALLELVDRARPARLEQAREGAVGEDLAAGLAARTVVGLVLGVHDALHRRAAHRAGFAKSSVHRHALAKGG